MEDVDPHCFQLSRPVKIDWSEEGKEELEVKKLEESGDHLKDTKIKIKQWLQLQVTPWAALKILSIYAVNQTSPKVSVVLLAMQPHKLPEGIVWKDVITRVVGPSNLIPVIEDIKTHIQSLMAEYEKLPSWVKNIIYLFKIARDPDTIPFRGTLHCKAVLV